MTNAAAINWNYCPWRSVSVDIKAASLIKGFRWTARDYHKNENHDSPSYQCTTSLWWNWNWEVVACIVVLILILRSRIILHLQDEEKWERSSFYCFCLLASFFIKVSIGHFRAEKASPLWCHEWPTYIANHICVFTLWGILLLMDHLDSASPKTRTKWENCSICTSTYML